jgi:mRNA interferase RelE/StbE
MYRLRFLETAIRNLAALDRAIGRRIVNRLRWLASNLNHLRPEALTGDLAGLYKLRVGDYRVIYEILREEQVLVIHFVGHRREVYRQR